MIASRFVAWMWGSSLMIFGAGLVSAQDYPSRPIRIVTSAPGGGTDFASRQIAPELASSLGQNVIVENRAGGAVQVFQAQPNGHTLLLAGTVFWIEPLFQKVSYDPVKNFLPVGLVSRQPLILVVHPSLPAKSIKELVALAKAKPGILNYSSAGTGSSGHLAGELLKVLAGVNIVRIPYKGGGPAMNDLIAGQVQMYFSNAASVMPHVKSGRLNALAVTSAQPSILVPGLPTVASAVPGFETGAMQGVFVPAGTPAAIINRLNQEIVRVINKADVKERFFNAGVEAVSSSPAEFGAMVKSDIARTAKLIRDADIRVD